MFLRIIWMSIPSFALIIIACTPFLSHARIPGTALVNLNAANSNQRYWFDQNTLQRGSVNLDSFDGATVEASLNDGTGILSTGGQYYWFDQTTLQRGSVGLDNFDNIIDSIHPLGDGTALVNLDAANNNQWYWFDQTTLQRGSVNLDSFDGATVEASLNDGTGILSTGGQYYWFDQTTLQRGSVGLDNFDNIIDSIHPLGDGTALVNLDAANNNQWYWFDQNTLQRGSVNLDNFDGATFEASLDDGTAILSTSGQYYWFDQTTLQRGSVGLDNFDNIIDSIHPLGDGTALVNLDAANNNQWYWFDQTTLQRGTVALDNFDGATFEASLDDGTAILSTGGQYYWFDQTTLQRGSVGLDNFDNAILEIHPLLDGTALVKTSFGAPNNQWYWFDQTTLQRGTVGLDNFDGAIEGVVALGLPEPSSVVLLMIGLGGMLVQRRRKI